MIVMEVQIIPMTAGISGISAGSTQFETGAFGNLGGEPLDPSKFTFAFLSLLVTQGIMAGLVIGKLSEGNITAGIKQSFVMAAMAVLISTGSKLILQS